METVTIKDVDLAIKRQRIFKEAKKNEEWFLEELENEKAKKAQSRRK